MKSILTALFISISTLFANTTISNLVYSAPGVKIYVVTVITDVNLIHQPLSLSTITNKVISKETNSLISTLEKKIIVEEDNIKNLSDLPVYYSDFSSPQSEYNINKLNELWLERNRSISNCNVMKLQLEKLKK